MQVEKSLYLLMLERKLVKPSGWFGVDCVEHFVPSAVREVAPGVYTFHWVIGMFVSPLSRKHYSQRRVELSQQ